jgi:hypothetical protein
MLLCQSFSVLVAVVTAEMDHGDDESTVSLAGRRLLPVVFVVRDEMMLTVRVLDPVRDTYVALKVGGCDRGLVELCH